MSPIGPVDSIGTDVLGDLPPLAQRSHSPGSMPSTGGFGDIFSEGLSQVNESLLANQTDLQRLATGDVENLHQIMIRLEESRLSFQLMLQVRNRLLESYQDVMKMQI